MQIVTIHMSRASCDKCGSNLTELGTHSFTGRVENSPTYRREHCICNACNEPFIYEYPIFDQDGHVSEFIFSGDINDPDYNWPDSLTEEQKKVVISHLENCLICRERITEEMLSDALFSSIIHKGRRK